MLQLPKVKKKKGNPNVVSEVTLLNRGDNKRMTPESKRKVKETKKKE